MTAALIALIPFLVPEALKLIKAIVEIRSTGATDQDIAALIAALNQSIDAKNAHTLELLAGIPESK